MALLGVLYGAVVTISVAIVFKVVGSILISCAWFGDSTRSGARDDG
jgi:hypothetical protein